MSKYTGGCSCFKTESAADPIDRHTCHGSVCNKVTGQDRTHVVFFKHGDLQLENEGRLKRQPFSDQNPDGPLELCVCGDCGTPIMLDDKLRRIRAVVPNLMGFDPASMPATYHAFFDPNSGTPWPSDGLPVHAALHPNVTWPDPS